MDKYDMALDKQAKENYNFKQNGFVLDGVPLPKFVSPEEMEKAETGEGVDFGIDIDDPELESLGKGERK
jgi:hypothetical protein